MVTPVDKVALTGHEPSKKRKLSDTIEVPPPKPNLCSRYGTLVLNTDSNAHYIRAELLLRHSTSFEFKEDIISATNKVHENDTVPSIRVSGLDEDWHFILSLLGGKTRIPRGSSFRISMVLPMLHIGHTYGFPSFKSAALQRLESILGRERLQDGKLARTLAAVRGYEFRLLDVVTEQGLSHLYPGAMYMCCIVATQNDSEIDHSPGHSLRYFKLASCLLKAREDLAQDCRLYTLSWWFDDTLNPSCQNPTNCASVVLKALKGSKVLAVHAIGSRPQGFNPGKLCSACKDAEARSYKYGRMNMLQELPTYFGFNKWPEVRNNDD